MKITSSQVENLRLLSSTLVKEKQWGSSQKKDSIEISNTAKAFQKLDDFLNLGKKDRMDLSGLSKEEKKEFLKMMATLIQHGIIGYQEYEINGKREKHYIVNTIGDERLYGAKPKYVREK
jgi:hypothetical protein